MCTEIHLLRFFRLVSRLVSRLVLCVIYVLNIISNNIGIGSISCDYYKSGIPYNVKFWRGEILTNFANS